MTQQEREDVIALLEEIIPMVKHAEHHCKPVMAQIVIDYSHDPTTGAELLNNTLAEFIVQYHYEDKAPQEIVKNLLNNKPI